MVEARARSRTRTHPAEDRRGRQQHPHRHAPRSRIHAAARRRRSGAGPRACLSPSVRPLGQALGAAAVKIANTIPALSIAVLALSSCKSDTPEAKSEPAAEVAAEATPSEAKTPTDTSGEVSGATTGELDRLLKWMPNEPLAVSWDRLGQRLDPTTLAVVFSMPPKVSHLLDERDTLDEALPLVFEGETDSNIWLSPTSFAFTIAL